METNLTLYSTQFLLTGWPNPVGQFLYVLTQPGSFLTSKPCRAAFNVSGLEVTHVTRLSTAVTFEPRLLALKLDELQTLK